MRTSVHTSSLVVHVGSATQRSRRLASALPSATLWCAGGRSSWSPRPRGAVVLKDEIRSVEVAAALVRGVAVFGGSCFEAVGRDLRPRSLLEASGFFRRRWHSRSVWGMVGAVVGGGAVNSSIATTSTPSDASDHFGHPVTRSSTGGPGHRDRRASTRCGSALSDRVRGSLRITVSSGHAAGPRPGSQIGVHRSERDTCCR